MQSYEETPCPATKRSALCLNILLWTYYHTLSHYNFRLTAGDLYIFVFLYLKIYS